MGPYKASTLKGPKHHQLTFHLCMAKPGQVLAEGSLSVGFGRGGRFGDALRIGTPLGAPWTTQVLYIVVTLEVWRC